MLKFKMQRPLLIEPTRKHQPPRQRNAVGFWHSDGSVKSIWHSFGTVRGEIGQMERQFCREVLYNLYVLHVGA
jgi:hypothetical protein